MSYSGSSSQTQIEVPYPDFSCHQLPSADKMTEPTSTSPNTVIAKHSIDISKQLHVGGRGGRRLGGRGIV